MTKLSENNLIFANPFLEFVYFNILSQTSRARFLEKINRMPYVGNTQANIQKIFVKRSPQQVIIFARFDSAGCLIEAFKFGQTDILTGKRAHVDTVEQILIEKTPEEITYFY